MANNDNHNGAPHKKYSNPVMRRSITLNTEFAQRIYNQSFGRTSRSLHAIDTILRIMGDDARVDKLEKDIAEKVGEWFASIRKEIEERDAELKEASIKSDDVQYSSIMQREIEVISPGTIDLIEIMETYDTMAIKIDLLWMNRKIASKDRVNLLFDWQRKTLDLSNDIVTSEENIHSEIKSERNIEFDAEQND